MPTPEKGGAPAPSKTSNARDELIARMAARVAEARGAEPMEEVAAPVEEPIEEPVAEPVVEPVVVEPQAADLNVLLKDFVVVSDGKPMLKLKVDGEERLVPFDADRVERQKQEAADKRLQQAAEHGKLLKQREEALQAREAELLARIQTSQLPPPGADDPSLDEEAKQLAHILLNATEDEVATVLKTKILRPRQVTPAVSQDEIVTRTVQTVEKRLTQKLHDQDVAAGFTQFRQAYPDIAADQKLFTVADGMTDEIAAEHPEWVPSQVMLEAGKRVKEWVDSFKPAPTPPTNDRQTRKEQLRPMPQARTGRVPTAEPEKPKTAAEIVAEMRATRGRAV